MSDQNTSMNLKDSLNLPITEFPMRGQLPMLEPKIIEQWESQELYEKVQLKNKGGEFFTMPDGPPYANGDIHLGHVLNKTLKDILIKFRSLQGYQAPFIPGWDCHGLPIEHKVTKELGKKNKDITKAQLRELCRKEALKWVGHQKEQFKRLGVMADWENPYLTLLPEYEAEEVRVLAKIFENGLIYQGTKPVYWCTVMQTALAETEVEYHDHVSDSIYVKFPFSDKSAESLGVEKGTSVVIWTTTPWTLPANKAVSFHDDFDYSAFKTKDFGTLIIATDLQEAFEKETEVELGSAVKTFKGKEFENLVLDHPFIPELKPLCILGKHVTLEAGTGCVHTAPGHGMDDYIVGLKYGLEVFSPVGPDGKYTEEYPDLQGVKIWDANPMVVEKLKGNNSLIFHKKFKHSYPHNWRSKTPLIYRATSQWFLKVDDSEFSVRDAALATAQEDTEFIPKWGQARLQSMVENRPDWCLSRQRNWGVPIPVFYCESCDAPLFKKEIADKVADKMEKEQGIEAYFSADASEFTEGHSCESCGHKEFKKNEDILDVWFDSGVCFSAVQKKREGLKDVADIYLEGSDQHRGWFQTSLLASLASEKRSPFKALLTHGFVNDANGRKMSKSLGNVIKPEQVIKKRGAEILRLWVAYEDYGQDVQVGEEIFQRVTESYRRFRNTYRFLLGNLSDFDYEKDAVDLNELHVFDQWALFRLNNLVEKSTNFYNKYLFHRVSHSLNEFFNVDLSSKYLDVLKDRLYASKSDDFIRRSSQTVIYHMVESLTTLMAPITSFLSEEAYGYFNKANKKESVFLESFPKEIKFSSDYDLEGDFERLFIIREAVTKDLEGKRKDKVIGSSLEAKLDIKLSSEWKPLIDKYSEFLEEFFIVSQVTVTFADSLDKEAVEISSEKSTEEKCPRCWKRKLLVEPANVCQRCHEALT